MTKDLALMCGPEQKWITNEFSTLLRIKSKIKLSFFEDYFSVY